MGAWLGYEIPGEVQHCEDSVGGSTLLADLKDAVHGRGQRLEPSGPWDVTETGRNKRRTEGRAHGVEREGSCCLWVMGSRLRPSDCSYGDGRTPGVGDTCIGTPRQQPQAMLKGKAASTFQTEPSSK